MRPKTVFRKVESKNVPYLQLWIMSTIISIFFVALIYTLLMIFYMNLLISLSADRILLFTILLLILINTLICEGKKFYLKKSKKEYDKVIIDHNGITFLNTYNQTIIAKILWKNIQPRENEKFDIDFYTRIKIGGAPRIIDYFFWNLKESNDSKIPLWSPNKFALMFKKFTNYADLLKAFFSGISLFRADITVNPGVYGMYRLNPASFDIDNEGIKKENRTVLLLIVSSIIITLIIICSIVFL
ncbi:hypothetical protein [Flavobacterium phragmitis]|uniref:Uncharacterized protein n=1 Tax=Flavobacterium phragmitis TaxID=739143 RepID=A0A1I1RX72_9FLAO|nr:hypothetical protein [Flavobacterium phragmitis]SFD38855.1 hypothetical protein SAMN05216297_107203 [Flavobacterium phragmitis]